MNRSSQSSDYFKSTSALGPTPARIRIGRRIIPTSVQDASIDGFTVLVNAVDATRLILGKPWVLMHENSTIEVHAQWFFHADQGDVQIGLRLVRDLTGTPKFANRLRRFIGLRD